MPVGYLDDVMLFQDFSQAWGTFIEAKDKDALPKHPLYDLCMEIWMDRNGEKQKRWKESLRNKKP